MVLFTATIVIIRVGEKEDILKWVHRSRASLAFLQLLMDQLAATLPHCPHYHHHQHGNWNFWEADGVFVSVTSFSAKDTKDRKNSQKRAQNEPNFKIGLKPTQKW